MTRKYGAMCACHRCGSAFSMDEPDCDGIFDSLDREWCFACAEAALGRVSTEGMCRAVWQEGVLSPPGGAAPRNKACCVLPEHGRDIPHQWAGLSVEENTSFRAWLSTLADACRR